MSSKNHPNREMSQDAAKTAQSVCETQLAIANTQHFLEELSDRESQSKLYLQHFLTDLETKLEVLSRKEACDSILLV